MSARADFAAALARALIDLGKYTDATAARALGVPGHNQESTGLASSGCRWQHPSRTKRNSEHPSSQSIGDQLGEQTRLNRKNRLFSMTVGGEGGIRTLDELTPITVFETAAFDHSATSPHRSRLFCRLPWSASKGRPIAATAQNDKGATGVEKAGRTGLCRPG